MRSSHALELVRRAYPAPLYGQDIEDFEPDVVPGSDVFASRIAKADDEFHTVGWAYSPTDIARRSGRVRPPYIYFFSAFFSPAGAAAPSAASSTSAILRPMISGSA